MEASRLGDRARSKLIRLLSDDHPEPGPWVGRLRSLSDLENTPVFATAVRFLFHLKVDDAEAELLLARVLDHRRALTSDLGRDPGLRVAAMDYLSNVEKRYENPKIVEMEEFEATERSARTDTLTGLANRRIFHETLDAEIRRSRRYRWPVTVLMLDLDHFKDVNDSWGHLLGDLVLERVGGVVRHAVRDADAACRFGGEEFAVVLPETAREGGYAVAERIRRRVEQAFQGRPVDGRDVTMTISAGLATFPEDALHAEALVARADEALYGAKHAGRNRVCVHYREKRGAPRFPVKSGTSVRIGRSPTAGALAVNLSRTGMLLDALAGFSVADRVSVQFVPGGDVGLQGQVVRVVADPARPTHVHVGVAFDEPIPEEQLMARVSLSRAGARGARGIRPVITREEASQLKEQLLQLLAEDTRNTERLLARLDALAKESGLEAYAALILILTQLAFDEVEARDHWDGILAHRHALSLALGRDAGLRVAVLDYFMNVNRRLVSPTLIDVAMEEAPPRVDGDALTGLAGDRAFRVALAGELRRARRYGHAVAVVVFDLDRFGEVNARVGRLVADRLLREAAMLLGNKIRDIDLAARPGEDELTLLLPQTDRNGAFLVAERFRRELEAHFRKREAGGTPADVTVSGGVAAYPEDGLDAEALIARAASALYQAKGSGKNAVLVHTPERRRFLRFDLQSRRCEIEVLAPGDTGAGRARNLSRNGLLFASPEPLDVGENVEIRLESGEGTEPLRVLTLRGSVVRLEETPSGENDRFEVGVVFDLDASQGEPELLEFLEHAGPERPAEPA